MSSINHKILGVSETATQEEIRKAYKRMAMIHHPDRGGDAAEFNRIRKAYKSLSKQNKCSICEGKGFVMERQGFFVKKVECPNCWST